MHPPHGFLLIEGAACRFVPSSIDDKWPVLASNLAIKGALHSEEPPPHRPRVLPLGICAEVVALCCIALWRGCPCDSTMAFNIQRAVFVVGVIFAVAFINRVEASSFTLVNNCDYTVWPGIQAGAGTSELSTTGFALSAGESMTMDVSAGWSGRLWGRTLCTFDAQGRGKCVTGDCGGSLLCNGNNAAPPATLAEFTFGQGTSPDFYDVSLVDGYNLPMMVSAKGGSGTCSSTGCVTDLNLNCPRELQIDTEAIQSVACKSACEAFGNPEYCCSGAFGNPNTCKPTSYSQLFKTACPKAYSYAFDDVTSTFTCTAADYVISFCPTVPSQKKSNDSPNSMVNDSNAWGVSTAANTSEAAASPSGGLLRALLLGMLSVGLLLSSVR